MEMTLWFLHIGPPKSRMACSSDFAGKRIQPGRPELFWVALAVLPIAVEPPLSPLQAKTVLVLCAQHGLTVYDATYLDVAKRKGLPLATLDADLIKAASEEGVPYK
jgi:predicted nucleic acid-binding protein